MAHDIKMHFALKMQKFASCWLLLQTSKYATKSYLYADADSAANNNHILPSPRPTWRQTSAASTVAATAAVRRNEYSFAGSYWIIHGIIWGSIYALNYYYLARKPGSWPRGDLWWCRRLYGYRDPDRNLWVGSVLKSDGIKRGRARAKR